MHPSSDVAFRQITLLLVVLVHRAARCPENVMIRYLIPFVSTKTSRQTDTIKTQNRAASLYADTDRLITTPCLKNNEQNCFCYNYVKLPPNLTIFGTMMANCLKLYEMLAAVTSQQSQIMLSLSTMS